MSRYSVTELMALQGTGSIDIGQFTIYALENNLLRRQKTGSTTEREPTSSESRRADRSTTTSDDSFQKVVSRPQSDSHDKDLDDSSGFVNFLKRHSSPKHQRVTPGGKVVHIDPKLPAPEFKPPTLKKGDYCPTKTGKIPTKPATSQKAHSEKKTAQTSGGSSNSNSVRFDTSVEHEDPIKGRASARGRGGSEEANAQPGGFQPPWQPFQQVQLPFLATDIYRQQPLPLTPGLGPIFQVLQPSPDPLSMAGYLNYPSLLLSDQGAWYQTAPQSYINQGAIIPNLSQQQTAPLLTTLFPAIGNQGATLSALNLADPHLNVQNTYALLGANSLTSQLSQPMAPYAGTLPTYVADQSTHRSLQDAVKEYQSLSTQLVNLDRYMAIHVFEMDAETKQGLVEQRRNLVKDLDMARRYKEHLESTLKLPSTLAGAAGAVPIFQQI